MAEPVSRPPQCDFCLLLEVLIDRRYADADCRLDLLTLRATILGPPGWCALFGPSEPSALLGHLPHLVWDKCPSPLLYGGRCGGLEPSGLPPRRWVDAGPTVRGQTLKVRGP